MATQAIAGFKARLYIASSSGAATSKVGELAECTLTIQEGAMDATSKDSGGWKEALVGLREWGLTGSGMYLLESSDPGQLLLYNEIVAQSNIYVNLYELSSQAAAPTSGAQVWLGNAVITAFDVESPLDKPAGFKLTLKGTGPLTKAAATS